MEDRRTAWWSTWVVIGFLVGFLLLPINRNTARQFWYMLNPAHAPKGSWVSMGGGRYIPYNYGDTWINRYRKLKSRFSPATGLKIAPRIIIPEEELEEVIIQKPNPSDGNGEANSLQSDQVKGAMEGLGVSQQ